MKQYKIGFIGCGNMASAIIAGIIGKKLLPNNYVKVFDVDFSKMMALNAKYDLDVYGNIEGIGNNADIIVLAVKPNKVAEALAQIDCPGKAIISIAAGTSIERLRSCLKVDARILRIMPNTPLLVGEGACVFAQPCDFTPEEYAFAKELFGNLGKVYEADEALLHAVTGVSGSGPAYVYKFINAMAMAGEKNGLPHELALETAVQTAIGAAKMIRESEKEPEQLIRDVCSPGGTTIEAVKVFDELDLDGIVEKAINACTEKSKVL